MKTVNITTILKAINTCYKTSWDVPVTIENQTLKYYFAGTQITFNSPYIVGEDSAISDIHTLTKFDIAGIHLANNKINLLSRTQSYTIPTKAGFPYIDKYDPQVTEMLTVDMQRVKEVYFAAAKNDSRAMLNAVCLCLGSDGQIIAYVATDAHRLSWSGTGNLAEFDQHKFMLLPRKLIDFMLKIKVDKFSFGYNPDTNHYRAVAELASDDTDNHTIEIIAQGIDCTKSADYAGVIPKNNDLTISLDIAALKQVAAMADLTNRYAAQLDLGRQEIGTSDSKEIGSFTVPNSLTCEQKEGKLNIQAKYLLDLIKQTKLTDRLEFKANSTKLTKSISFTNDTCHCCGNKLPYSIIHVIMPLLG